MPGPKQKLLPRAKKAAKATAKANKKALDAAVEVRQKMLGSPEALSNHVYDPNKVYTFEYYDSYFRADSFMADLGLVKMDLASIAGEQPLVIDMAKTTDTAEYLWKFEIWHARALSNDSPRFAANAPP